MNTPFPSAMTVTRASLLALLAVPLAAQTADRLVGQNVSIAQTNYKGRSAIQVIATPGAANASSYAVIKDVLFRDGTIEVDLAGQPAAGAEGGARGFIGIAFRLQGNGSYEYIYLRPTNGRAEDQIRRNHSTQYSSHPDFEFARSRQEAPEKYESYVDLQPGVWTKYKIEVEGRKARLYVHGAEQPCFIVNDLKLEPREGGVALWVGPGTEGYFSNLKIVDKFRATLQRSQSLRDLCGVTPGTHRGAFAHPDEAQLLVDGDDDPLRVKPYSVILDDERHPIGPALKGDDDVSGVGMFGHIV